MNKKSFRPESLLKNSSKGKLPIILQSEGAECGLTCFAMISGYYNHYIDPTALRHKYSISSHGATLKQLIDLASKFNFSTRPLRLEIDQLKNLRTPCILHWELRHFVVLKKVTDSGIVIHDPNVGARFVKMDDVDCLFSGVALELTPAPNFIQVKEKNKLKLSSFWNRIVGFKRSLLIMLVTAMLLQVFSIITPFYMQTVIDDAIFRSDTNILTVLALGFSLLLIFELGVFYVREIVVLNFSTRLNIQFSSNVYHHLIRLPMGYFVKRHIGDVISRFGSLGAIRNLLTTGIVTITIDGIMALLTLSVMLMYDVTLSFIVIGAVLLYAILRYILYVPIRSLNEEYIASSAKEESHFIESIKAIQTIKLFEKEGERESHWQNKLADSINKQISIAKWNIGFRVSNRVLFGLENILLIYFAAISVINNALSIGMLFAFISYKVRFISSMNSLIEKSIEFKMLDLHFDRLADIIFTEQDRFTRENSESQIVQEPIKGRIRVTNLSYAYSELENAIFHNINLSINAGETVAFVGQSGCGKTTFIRCIMGLITPSGGVVQVDDTPISQIPNYRKHVAAVMQNDQLLSGTIANNISCLEHEMDMERVTICAHLACIHDEIKALPMQYNTLIGSMGTGLSGGQIQRIMIARAFYKNPRILIMDEATSQLDVKKESEINKNIKALAITRLIIAHRPETIKAAQRVFRFENQTIREVFNE